MTLNSTAVNVARVVGPAVAAILISTIGIGIGIGIGFRAGLCHLSRRSARGGLRQSPTWRLGGVEEPDRRAVQVGASHRKPALDVA